MACNLTPLKPEAIDALAKIIGNYFSGSEITRLFKQSGYTNIEHDGSTKWRFVSEVFQQMQNNNAKQPHAILAVVKNACSPQRWLNRKEDYDSILCEVNEVLGFYGLKIYNDGSLKTIGEVSTTVKPSRTHEELIFDGRGFHPHVVKHGRNHFIKGSYFHAVFECCKAFDKAVRDNTFIPKSGHALMAEALNLNGVLKLNGQRNQSERDEQQGIMYLCMGLMSAIRNPQAHEPELNWVMTREDALDVLALLSFLFRKLENGVVYNPSTKTVSRVHL